MKLLLVPLLAAFSTNAFSPNSISNVRSSISSTTFLNNGMDAYDAQMKAAYGGGSTVTAAQPSLSTPTDNFKSSPRWRKKTKQLATLGPASSDFEMIEKLFLAGECSVLRFCMVLCALDQHSSCISYFFVFIFAMHLYIYIYRRRCISSQL